MELPLRKLKIALSLIWVFLVAAGFSVEFWKYVLDGERNSLVYFFGLSYEQNLPTWYASGLLLLCGVLLLLIAWLRRQQRARYAGHWFFLGIAFLYISLDEAATIHEEASSWFDLGGLLYFGWVIPASIVVTVVGICYVRFLAQLPRRTRRQFVLAGSIYVGGALGVELLLGYWTDLAGTRNLVYGLIDLVEESMEILGVSLFLLALVEYLVGSEGQFQLAFRAAETAQDSDSLELAASNRGLLPCPRDEDATVTASHSATVYPQVGPRL